MNLSYHRSDTQYHLLRKILGTLQGGGNGGGGLNVSASTPLDVVATGVSKVITPVTDTVANNPMAAGDALTTMFEIPDAVRVAGKHTILHSAILTDTSAQNTDTYLLLYNNAGTDAAIGVPLDLTIGLSGLVGVITFDDFVTIGGVGVCGVRSIGLVIPPMTEGTSLWGVLVTGGTPTYLSTSALGLKLGFLQD